MKKIYGTFGVEVRAYGQKLVKFCTQTHASPLVVYLTTVLKVSKNPVAGLSKIAE